MRVAVLCAALVLCMMAQQQSRPPAQSSNTSPSVAERLAVIETRLGTVEKLSDRIEKLQEKIDSLSLQIQTLNTTMGVLTWIGAALGTLVLANDSNR